MKTRQKIFKDHENNLTVQLNGDATNLKLGTPSQETEGGPGGVGGGRGVTTQFDSSGVVHLCKSTLKYKPRGQDNKKGSLPMH